MSTYKFNGRLILLITPLTKPNHRRISEKFHWWNFEIPLVEFREWNFEIPLVVFQNTSTENKTNIVSQILSKLIVEIISMHARLYRDISGILEDYRGPAGQNWSRPKGIGELFRTTGIWRHMSREVPVHLSASRPAEAHRRVIWDTWIQG